MKLINILNKKTQIPFKLIFDMKDKGLYTRYEGNYRCVLKESSKRVNIEPTPISESDNTDVSESNFKIDVSAQICDIELIVSVKLNSQKNGYLSVYYNDKLISRNIDLVI